MSALGIMVVACLCLALFDAPGPLYWIIVMLWVAYEAARLLGAVPA